MGILTIKYDAEPASLDDELVLCKIIRLGGLHYRRLASIENQHREAMKALEQSDPVMSDLFTRLREAADTDAEPIVSAMRVRRKELSLSEANDPVMIGLRNRLDKAVKDDPVMIDLSTRLEEEEVDVEAISSAMDVRRRELEPTLALAIVARRTALAPALALTQDYRNAVKVLYDQVYAEKKRARDEAGLSGSWATYQLVEEAHDTSRSTTAWPKGLSTFTPVDEGAVAVHSQGKRIITRDNLFACDWSFAQIDPEPYGLGHREPAGLVDGRWMPGHAARAMDENDRGRAGWRGAARYRELRIRVDSQGRAPVWARMHVLMLPGPSKVRSGKTLEIPKGKITWIRVHRRRVGIRYQWSVQIVVDAEERPARGTPTAELVAIDLRCGRRVEGGRLLAYAIGSDGEHHKLVIPDHRLVDGRSRGVVDYERDKPAELASIRDNALNNFLPLLRDYRESLPEDHWIREELSHVHAWRSWGRVGGFFSRWRGNRFPGDEAFYERVEQALKRDRHLLSWQAHAGSKRQHRIRGAVDQWTALLVKSYGTIAIEDLKIKSLVRPDNKEDRLAHVLAQRVQVLAPGHLRDTLKRFAKAWGRGYLVVSSVDMTRTCDHCGAQRQMNAGDIIKCEACGRSSPPWVSAAKNILRRASAAVQEASLEPQVAEKRKGRHNRKGTARKSSGN